MKASLILFLFVAILVGCKSGGNTNNADTAVGTESDMGTVENTDTWNQDQITDFVNDAVVASMMEVQLGQIAQKKALSQEVRDYGKMMEKDHSDASNKLKPVLQTLNLSAPETMDKEHQDKIDNLNKKTGKDFDKEYVDEMVKDHKDDVEDFEEAQKKLPSGELKTWVETTLPALRQHLIQAETLQEQIKNQK